MVLYLIHYDTLLENATELNIKCDSCFITKRDKRLLQNASAFLLQNATVTAKCYNFFTKCNSYCKMQCLLQNAAIHGGLHLYLTAQLEYFF